MKALQSAKKNNVAEHGGRTGGPCGRRVVSLLLCFCMLVSLLSDFGGLILSSAVSPTDQYVGNVTNRVADANTMDDYLDQLLSGEWGSRYAGRIWTDKSVFAYIADGENKIDLDMETDGYNGSVGFSADFAHVFSALASSQRVNEYPPSPIDLLILLDMSGSMATDIVDGASHADYNQPDSLRVSHSRIYAVLESVNNSIKEIMDMGEDFRVAVVGYGATAYTLLELGHYKTETDSKYLEVKDFRNYYNNIAPTGKNGASYLVGTVAGLQKLGDDGSTYSDYARYARNAYNADSYSCDPEGTVNIGMSTNMQVGIYEGFEELYKHYNTKEDVTKTYSSADTGEPVVVQRIPVAIVMSDGASNYALKANTKAAATGGEWYQVPNLSTSVKHYKEDVDFKKYRTETDGLDCGGDATILDILLTASYEKSKVQKKYEELVLAAKAAKENPLTEERFKGTEFRILTVSVDTPITEWQKPRVYATLDPVNFFKADPQAYNGIDPGTWKQKNDIVQAYNAFIKWSTSDAAVSIKFKDSDNDEITVSFNQLPQSETEATGVTKDDIIQNINYNTRFADISSNVLTSTFESMINEIRGIAFMPLSGENDSGVEDSITYQDPLGAYMEIKNQAISAKVHGKEEEEAAKYDMALLVFGKMHGLVRVGVYDYQWNNAWMEKHKSEDDPTDPSQKITPDKTPFPMGWYRGDDPEKAERAEHTTSDGSGTYPDQYNNAAEAEADGWVFRLNFKTLLNFVPIADAPEDGLPDGLSEQIKNTVYTCYRFAGTTEERNALHMNPIFGTDADIPQYIQEKWREYEKDKQYPETNDLYAGVPGVYRLSDIRVWVEELGDYMDTTGVIAPNTGYDRSLYMNIPAAAVPMQLATVTIDQKGACAYQTNLATDKNIDYETVKTAKEGENNYDLKQQYENYAAQSTPLRLFYAVGLEEDLILRDSNGDQTGVDFSKISPEYIKSHTVEGQDYIWFVSNYFSNTTYDDYVTGAAQASRGDPAMTFSPNRENRYYIFQKALPLYAHAYRVQQDGTLKAVDYDGGSWRDENDDWTEDHENGKGNGGTTWESISDSEGKSVQQSAGSWVGGEYMGTYTNEDAFKDAKTAMDDSQYITDSTGTKYLYVADGIVFFTDDALNHVTSEEDGSYTKDSISFSSDDYFFLLIEYYMPVGELGSGVDEKNETIAEAYGCRMVQRVVARKGSEFGSAFVSEKINNGDMLCWTSVNKNINVLFDYLSKTDTGDLTRGEPAFEKLTQADEGKLRQYLTETCGITEDKMMDNPDYDPADPSKGDERIKVLDYQVKYWLALQKNTQIQAALAAADKNGGGCDQGEFTAAFSFCVAAKPGGIRSGNMANNVHAKKNNVTRTAENYYVPVVSENSGIGDESILNNYMGNNGYLEVANQQLHITKLLEVPEGFELTDGQLSEAFNYQIYVQGVTGTRNAVLTQYNEYSGTWERQLAYIDVLTDNSGLVVDNSSNRALFIKTTVPGTAGDTLTAKQVIANGTYEEDGSPVYYEANEDGTLTFEDGKVTNTQVPKGTDLFYLYLPPNGTGTAAQQTRRLYQNQSYDGTADGYSGTYKDDKAGYERYFGKNGTTTFFEKGHRKPTGTEGGKTDRDSFRETDDPRRPAGTVTYWAQDAELIPVSEVTAAETPDNSILGEPGGGGSIATSALESAGSESGMWVHKPHDGEEGKNHVALQFFTFVIRRPEGETSATAFESPFMTRSQYMTMELKFGVAANKEDGVGSAAAGNSLTAEDLYDPIIPSADRPDLFGTRITNDYIARHTAEFTLRHGEGLLLSGLDNRITYRITEKLTDAQLAKGYRLKEISHVQQVGSESIYRPGVQNVPVYTAENATYGSRYPAEIAEEKTDKGLTWPGYSGAEKKEELFAHTNAVMWEYYATMDAGSSGNHHQPDGVDAEKAPVYKQNEQVFADPPTNKTPVTDPVETNPSCTIYDANTKTGCDEQQEDGSVRHYMYRDGVLIDSHYEGEASAFLRNMSRYLVSPTVRFGLTGEAGGMTQKTDPESYPGDGSVPDYSGVYSVFGNTGWFEEQVNYINTIDPEMLVLTKTVADQNGVIMDPQPDREFTFTVEFTAPASTKTAMEKVYEDTDSNPETPPKHTLYVWEDSIDDLGKAPKLDEYLDFIGKGLEKIELEPSGTKDTYTAKLKAGQAIVFYGLLPGTTYTVTEEMDERYPAVDPSLFGSEDADGDFYTRTGTVRHDLADEIAMKPEKTENRADFYDQLETGTLTVEKKVLGDPVDSGREFKFEVKLTPAKGTELSKDDLTVTKKVKAADGTETKEVLALDWKGVKDDGSLTAEFTLKHGERITIEGIPLDTVYTVREPVSGRMGYTLEHVANNEADDPVDGGYLDFNRADSSVTGTLTETESMRVYLLFANRRATALPLSGGIGVGAYWLAGAALLLLFCALGVCYCRKYGR